jgi:hypothetical protein
VWATDGFLAAFFNAASQPGKAAEEAPVDTVRGGCQRREIGTEKHTTLPDVVGSTDLQFTAQDRLDEISFDNSNAGNKCEDNVLGGNHICGIGRFKKRNGLIEERVGELRCCDCCRDDDAIEV